MVVGRDPPAQLTKTRREREATSFRARVVDTLTQGQNALNIAFGAILSAYVGNVLTIIDNAPFNHWALAGFFVLLGTFIGGLCLGNAIVLDGHIGLGALFMAGGAIAACISLKIATLLAFEVPILKILYVCWVGMLVGSNVVLTVVIFLHHKSVA